MAHELFTTACENEDFKEVERILQDEQEEVDVDYQGYFQNTKDTVLLRAAELGELAIVKLLLKRGADANLENKGRTPLFAAIKGRHWDVAKTLLKHEDLDVCTFDEKKEWSPLHLAVKSDRVDIVRLILDKDRSGIDQRDKRDRTPLDLAFERDSRNCVLALLEHGANTWAMPPQSRAIRLVPPRLDFMRQALRLRAVHEGDRAVDEADRDGWTPLHYAADRRVDRAIKLLLIKNADPNRRDKDTWMPLHRAVYVSWWVDPDDGEWGWTHPPRLETVQELLACHTIDVNAVTEFGRTPLILAINPTLPDGAEPVPCVRSLICAGADTNAVTKDGETALHHAIEVGNDSTAFELAELLVKEGKANVNCATKHNVTPLSAAIKCGNDQVVELLLEAGADMAAAPTANPAQSRPQALALVMREDSREAQFPTIARSLCARGAKWDDSCDNEVLLRDHGAKWRDWCSGMRASVEHWTEQLERKVYPLTDIPVEVIRHGAKSVESYLERAERSPSKAVLRRCKVCVVGPTEWGKTTLAKALTTEKGACVDPGVDGRTVGIDLQPLEFTIADKRHEVTLWDFAGQNEYQGAHSLFYSPKSLYLLCVDLGKYNEAMKTNKKNAMEKFVRENIFSWVRAVTARHKEKPMFVVVGTKFDKVKSEEVKAIWEDLRRRWQRAFEFKPQKEIHVNNLDTKSVLGALEDIKPIISRSGTDLPADDVRVLAWICSQRSTAGTTSTADRVERVMRRPGELQQQLLDDIPNLGKAEDILRLLHDLGDVYWHDWRSDTVVLDPSLLLEFVKEIITHNYDKDADERENLEEGRVCHKSLSKFPHWKCLVEDDELMLDLKCLLQQLRLAYPYSVSYNDKEMQWNSDLIVPAYWRRRDRKASKGLLRDRSVVERRGVAPTVEYWLVYKLPPELSDVVFEQFAVQNRMFDKREISRNMIEDNINDCVATTTLEHADLTAMDSEHSESSRPGRHEEHKVLDTINLQVGGSNRANVLRYLLYIVDAMEQVLEDGIGVSRYVKDPADKDREWKDLHKEMEHFAIRGEDFFSLNEWMPRNFKMFSCDPKERHHLLLEEGMTRLSSVSDKILANSTELLTNHDKLKELVQETRDTSWKLLDNNKVLENLLRTTDTRRRYPTRWTLTYNKVEGQAELRMLCDLEDKCPFDPKPITIRGSDFLARNSKFMKGCAWLMTVFKKVVTLGLLEDLVDKLASDFQAKIEKSEKMDDLVGLLDLSHAGATLVGEKVSEPVAAWFLHEFLKLHDPSFEVLKLPILSNLESKTNKDGIWIWAHPGCDQSGDSKESVQQPEEESDPNSGAPSGKKKTFAVQLRSLRITGLSGRDKHKVFVYWALEGPRQDPAAPAEVFCSGTTPQHSNEADAPSWKDLNEKLSKIASLKQLADCNLRMEVKRPSRLPGKETVTSCTGSTFLTTHFVSFQDDASSCTVHVDVELAKEKTVPKCAQAKVTVEFKLA